MSATDDLDRRVGVMEGQLSRVEASLDGIRHAQNIGLGAVALAVAVVGVLITIGIFEVQSLDGNVSATNMRLDHQIEQQSATANAAQAAANARMDRLLELYAQQIKAPNAQPSPEPVPPSRAPSLPSIKPSPSSFPMVEQPHKLDNLSVIAPAAVAGPAQARRNLQDLRSRRNSIISY